MATPTAAPERERLLKLAEEYRSQGYEILLHPSPEDLPDFLKPYRPDMVVRRGNKAAVVEITSRASLRSSSAQYLRDLAQAVEEHPGWRFELVMTNPEDAAYDLEAESSLQEPEIAPRLQIARQLATAQLATAQLATAHLESALLYAWSLVEAALRLVAEREGLSLQRVDALYLIKQLATEGVISRSEYQTLMNARSLRNAIAHGFRAAHLRQESVHELINIAEQLLESLRSS